MREVRPLSSLEASTSSSSISLHEEDITSSTSSDPADVDVNENNNFDPGSLGDDHSYILLSSDDEDDDTDESSYQEVVEEPSRANDNNTSNEEDEGRSSGAVTALSDLNVENEDDISEMVVNGNLVVDLNSEEFSGVSTKPPVIVDDGVNNNSIMEITPNDSIMSAMNGENPTTPDDWFSLNSCRLMGAGQNACGNCDDDDPDCYDDDSEDYNNPFFDDLVTPDSETGDGAFSLGFEDAFTSATDY